LRGFGINVFALIQKDHQSRLDHHISWVQWWKQSLYRFMRKYDKSILISRYVIFEEISNAYIEAIDKIQHPFQLTLRI
jgi:hypothetical protein